MRGWHVLVVMIVAVGALRLWVVGRARSGRWPEVTLLAGGWLGERLKGVRVSRIVVAWVAVCLCAAALLEWLALR